MFTLLIYLNGAWRESTDGGALRIHVPAHTAEGEAPAGTTPCVDVYPHAGTVVLFRSDVVMHEVRPAHKPRFAASMWFHRRA